MSALLLEKKSGLVLISSLYNFFPTGLVTGILDIALVGCWKFFTFSYCLIGFPWSNSSH